MDQPQGNFVGFAPRYKQPGDKRPNFEGRITIPGTDREFRVALWADKDKHGRVMFSGRSADISSTDTALQQIESLAGGAIDAKTLEENGIRLEPGQLVAFTNGFKDEANPNRPDFYGRWNPGSGEQLVSVSVWARKDKFQQPMLTGQTQYPIPGKNAALEAGEPQPETVETSLDTKKRVGGRSR